MTFGRVSEWCDLWGMTLNASKTKTMIVFRSLAINPQSTLLTLDGAILKESDDLVILGVIFYAKITFVKHLRSVVKAAVQRVDIAWLSRVKYYRIDRFEIYPYEIATSGTIMVLFIRAMLSCRFTPYTTGQSCKE